MDHLQLDDAAILRQCDVHTYRSSGPGGQHRNKVSSAVRLIHRPTGITAHGDGSRSQHENKRTAIRRLRAKIACQIRKPLEAGRIDIPPVVQQCLIGPSQGKKPAARRLQIGRKDRRFWPVAAFLLDLLEAFDGRFAEAAAVLDITTSNLTSVLKSDRHLLAAAQILRKRCGLGPLF